MMVNGISVTRPLELMIDPYACPRPLGITDLFHRVSPVDLEIGFGHGDFLIRSALENPERDFIGVEQEWERVKRTLNKIKDSRKRLRVPGACDNIRLLRMDAAVALERLFAPWSLSKVFCLFPCPWPKKKHIKYRLFSNNFFKLINSRLADKGEVKIVTDARPYFEWMLEEVKGAGFERESDAIAPLYNTKYERKWLRSGRTEFFELRLRKERHQSVAVKEDEALNVYFAEAFEPGRLSLKGAAGRPTVVFKEFLFDSQRQKGLVYAVVSDDTLAQHVYISVGQTAKGWRVAKADGLPVIPTAGVAEAIRLVYESVRESGK